MVKHEKSKEQRECLRENYKIVLQKLWEKKIWKHCYFFELLMKQEFAGMIY